MLENNFCTICKICGEETGKTAHFWEEHRISLKSYFYSHYPKVCLQTGKLIPFKSPDQYISQDFFDKNSLKAWLKAHPDDAVLYSLSLIKDRFDKGKIVYAPSEVELKSLCCPNVVWYESVCNYNLECRDIGLKTRFKYKIDNIKINSQPLEIKIDSREQKPWKFPKNYKTEIKGLKYSDYWCSNSEWTHIYVERKGLSDFVSTIAGGFDRFEREIIRCQEDNNYLIILVEESIGNALAFNMLPHISKNIKASPDFIFHRVRELIQKYSNIQFLFAPNRIKAVELVGTIYNFGEDPAQFDWQYLLHKKLI